MIVTITQYDRLASDRIGNPLPVGAGVLASEARTTAGAFAALNSDARFVRVASDTNVKLTWGAVTMYFPANAPDFVAVNGAEVMTLATV